MTVSKKTEDDLLARMRALGICEDDIEEKFILGSGAGGQKINKTHSCVYLKHLPTGIEIKCQRERSRELNRFYARRLLCDKVDFQRNQAASKIEQEREKIRRQKRKRSKRAKDKMLAGKALHAGIKAGRQKVRED